MHVGYYGKTKVVVCDDEMDLGKKAAHDVAQTMRRLLAHKKTISMVLAAGESQATFLDALATEKDIQWSRVICFNMDDFYDRHMPEECTCGYQTKKQLYEKVNPKQAYLVRYNASDPEKEAKRFENLLRQTGKIDVTCQGIGTSGHLALNEPGQTDFNDRAWVKLVDIAEQSKKQLKADPNFKSLGYIPAQGITMTIPALISAENIFTIVPLSLKRPILEKLFKITTPTTELPASILLQVEGILYVDRNSCPETFPIGN